MSIEQPNLKISFFQKEKIINIVIIILFLFYLVVGVNIYKDYGFDKKIEELKDDFRIRNQITPEKHMARLNHLGRKAETKDMIGVAVNAEVHRGKMAGYYVEKKLIANQTLEDMTEEQINEKLKKIEEQYNLIVEDNHDKD